MKKVSAKTFFTVMWSGLCQAAGWFFGLFGYKRDGKFAKCVWGVFALSGTALLLSIAYLAIEDTFIKPLSIWYEKQYGVCDDPYCYNNTRIGPDIYFHSCDNDKGYIYNIATGEKYLKKVAWIAEPAEGDSLVCFSNGRKRGYFSKNTGKVILPPQYDHAWIFSDGVACVDEGGTIKVIDSTGETILDMNRKYAPGMRDFVFHNGCIVFDTEESELCGLMDKTGCIVLPQEYTSVQHIDDSDLWKVTKDEETGIYDKELNPVIPLMEGSFYIAQGTIDVTLPDHTMRKYDMQGTLIHDFYIVRIKKLEYEKDEILYRQTRYEDEGDYFMEAYHPEATARLRAYVAGDNYLGLIDPDGHIVTPPLYQNIIAVGPNLYLCTATNYDKVVLNGKGEIVK